jgi:hypothetical protein
MTKQIRLIAYAVGISALVPLDVPAAHAIDCQVARPSNAQKHWTYRLVDGRKCWYEGRSMISRSLLQWPATAPATTKSGEGSTKASEGSMRSFTEKPADPMDSQARMPGDDDDFESRWRARAIHR